MNTDALVKKYQDELNEIQKHSDFGSLPDDKAAVIALTESIEALKEGNYAIGACLVDNETGNTVLRSHNQVFEPYFRSEAHAEMLLLSQMEGMIRGNRSDLSSMTLVSTLEPCPMCTARCISSGIKTVKFIAPDELGGMVHLMNQMPEVWKNIAKEQKQIFQEADCHPSLKSMALDIFLSNREILDEKLARPSQKPFKIPSDNATDIKKKRINLLARGFSQHAK